MAFVRAVAISLATYNNLVALLEVPQPVRFGANLALAGLLLVAARAQGLSAEALGLARGSLRPGLRWGGAVVGVAALGLATLFATPFGRRLRTRAKPSSAPASSLAHGGINSLAAVAAFLITRLA